METSNNACSQEIFKIMFSVMVNMITFIMFCHKYMPLISIHGYLPSNSPGNTWATCLFEGERTPTVVVLVSAVCVVDAALWLMAGIFGDGAGDGELLRLWPLLLLLRRFGDRDRGGSPLSSSFRSDTVLLLHFFFHRPGDFWSIFFRKLIVSPTNIVKYLTFNWMFRIETM